MIKAYDIKVKVVIDYITKFFIYKIKNFFYTPFLHCKCEKKNCFSWEMNSRRMEKIILKIHSMLEAQDKDSISFNTDLIFSHKWLDRKTTTEFIDFSFCFWSWWKMFSLNRHCFIARSKNILWIFTSEIWKLWRSITAEFT